MFSAMAGWSELAAGSTRNTAGGFPGAACAAAVAVRVGDERGRIRLALCADRVRSGSDSVVY